MDTVVPEGVIITPLQRIAHPKGDVLRGIKKSDSGFEGFGEAYFSKINFGEIKGWNQHFRMTLNLIVPVGKVSFVIFDDREHSLSRKKFSVVTLSPENYCRLTVAPHLFLAFKGVGASENIILNVANLEHDPEEKRTLGLEEIPFEWNAL